MKKSALIIFLVLLVDQILKIYIKTTFLLGEEVHVMGDWFIIHFTENPGMAFGYEFGFSWGKLALSLFRIGAIIALGFYIAHIVKRKVSTAYIASISLIMAGALGNMIDSAFYGMIFSESKFHEVAVAFPYGGSYADFLHGKVVDMFYFPLFSFTWPQWMPWLGGQFFTFFQPVFNVADASITVGVFIILLFQKSFFKKG